MNNEYEQQAIARLRNEEKSGSWDKREKVMKGAVLEALESFLRMPPEQGRAEKQEILTAYLTHCAEQLVYYAAAQEVAG